MRDGRPVVPRRCVAPPPEAGAAEAPANDTGWHREGIPELLAPGPDAHARPAGRGLLYLWRRAAIQPHPAGGDV